MTERFFDGRWIYEPQFMVFRWIPAGFRDDAEMTTEWPEGTVAIMADMIPGLVSALENHGHITPRLDDRIRSEDLKITHRLLDLLEKRP